MSLIITKAGLLALNAAEASGAKLQATHMAVGDGAGQTPEHTNASTELVNEVWRGALDAVTLREDGQTESGQAVEFRAHIPMTTGGWYIREVAIYADDVLLAIGAHPVMWKPAPDDPTKLEHTIYAPVVFGNAGTLALTIDPSKVLATRQAVEEEIAAHNNSPEAHGEAFQALAGHIQDKDDPHATLPPGGEAGQVIIKQEDGSLAWEPINGTFTARIVLTTSGLWVAPVTGWYRVTVVGGGGGGGKGGAIGATTGGLGGGQGGQSSFDEVAAPGGGGGGGGASNAGTYGYSGGGGGAGGPGECVVFYVHLTKDQSCNVVIGAGGIGATATAGAMHGGDGTGDKGGKGGSQAWQGGQGAARGQSGANATYGSVGGNGGNGSDNGTGYGGGGGGGGGSDPNYPNDVGHGGYGVDGALNGSIPTATNDGGNGGNGGNGAVIIEYNGAA